MVDDRYLKVDCIVMKWNMSIPAVFLIFNDEKRQTAAVFDKRTNNSLDSKKGRAPRPLKAHAYNFGKILNDKGKEIIEKRAASKDEAEDFSRRIIESARPISSEEYAKEIMQIIWPEDFWHPDDLQIKGQKKIPECGLTDEELIRKGRKELSRGVIDMLVGMSEEDLRSLYKYANMLTEKD